MVANISYSHLCNLYRVRVELAFVSGKRWTMNCSLSLGKAQLYKLFRNDYAMIFIPSMHDSCHFPKSVECGFHSRTMFSLFVHNF
jgi:hypothetical protein